MLHHRKTPPKGRLGRLGSQSRGPFGRTIHRGCTSSRVVNRDSDPRRQTIRVRRGRALAKRDCIRPSATGSHAHTVAEGVGVEGGDWSPPPTVEPCEKVSGTRVPVGGRGEGCYSHRPRPAVSVVVVVGTRYGAMWVYWC